MDRRPSLVVPLLVFLSGHFRVDRRPLLVVQLLVFLSGHCTIDRRPLLAVPLLVSGHRGRDVSDPADC